MTHKRKKRKGWRRRTGFHWTRKKKRTFKSIKKNRPLVACDKHGGSPRAYIEVDG